MSTKARSTIVVTPREANSTTVGVVERLLEATTVAARLVVVDAGSSDRIAGELAALAATHDFTLIRSDTVLTGNEARNLALPHVDTEFVAFVENDVLVESGWLAGLQGCADDTGATLVSPVILWGPKRDRQVHFAGGVALLVEDEKGLRYDEHNHEIFRPISQRPSYERSESPYVELHCFLARADALEHFGQFDEALKSTVREKADFTLRVAQNGGSAWMEPSVEVSYQYPKPMSTSDHMYFRARWSEDWNDPSLRHFNDKWNLTNTEIDDLYRTVPMSRRLGWRRWGLTGWKRKSYVWRRRFGRAIDIVATPLAVREINHRRSHAEPAFTRHQASWDDTALRM